MRGTLASQRLRGVHIRQRSKRACDADVAPVILAAPTTGGLLISFASSDHASDECSSFHATQQRALSSRRPRPLRASIGTDPLLLVASAEARSQIAQARPTVLAVRILECVRRTLTLAVVLVAGACSPSVSVPTSAASPESVTTPSPAAPTPSPSRSESPIPSPSAVGAVTAAPATPSAVASQIPTAAPLVVSPAQAVPCAVVVDDLCSAFVRISAEFVDGRLQDGVAMRAPVGTVIRAPVGGVLDGYVRPQGWWFPGPAVEIEVEETREGRVCTSTPWRVFGDFGLSTSRQGSVRAGDTVATVQGTKGVLAEFNVVVFGRVDDLARLFSIAWAEPARRIAYAGPPSPSPAVRVSHSKYPPCGLRVP